MNILKTMVFLKNFMAIGLGHKYLVHQISRFTGTLEECINYIKNNKPGSKYNWYELNPNVDVKNKCCETYTALLLEIDDQP